MDGPVAAAAVADLRSRLSGELVGPDHPSYEELRRVHNGTIDRRPALIARCKNTADVVDAVTFGQEAGLELSVRGGGHSVAGRAVTDGRLMIDLQPMKGIHVDPRARRARAQGGVTWGEYNRATHAFGVATTGGVISTTGIVGLTLGGGMGWLLGRFGLAIDNLLSAEIVTADGEIRTASAEDEPDLFWALRGGGGNFGVVTSFEYRTHPLRSVLGGLLAFPFAEAHRVFDAFRQATAELPDELTLFFGLVHAPDGSGEKLAALAACHSGEPAKADVDLKPLRSMPSLLLDGIETMPYPVVNTLLDDGYPKGARNYWKSAFMNDLSDDSVEVMIEAFASTPSSMNSILVEHYHGQATRVGVTDTAFPHREAGYNLGVFAEWLESADDAANTKWTKDSFSSLGRFVGDVSYVNYLDHDDGARVRAAYGPNWPRLLELKRRYDPKNVFHLNQNIDPRGD